MFQKLRSNFFVQAIMVIIISLVFSVSAFNIANASTCTAEEGNSSCRNDVYMGAKWVGNVSVDLTLLHDSTIATYMRSAMSHYNSLQSYVKLVEVTSTPTTRGHIKATDAWYPWESWTGNAYNSWYGGWPIDTYYNNVEAVKIVFNTATYFEDATTNQKIATPRHELGHAIGLGHRSSKDLLMYCSRARTVYGLTSGDIEILDIIY
ncbi:hypothetical protein [Ureibacillus acetophenoni]